MENNHWSYNKETREITEWTPNSLAHVVVGYADTQEEFEQWLWLIEA